MADLATIANLVAPFFGLILLGFVIGRWKRLPEAGLVWLQFFLIYVALPPLFYRLIADKPVTELANGRFILATTLSTLLVFMLSLAVGLRATRGDLPQAVMQGVAGSYSNIGYMGPPLLLAALGPAASAPLVLIFVFDSLLLFSIIPFLMALAGVEKRSPLETARRVAWQVASHPFNVATLLGILASATHFELPSVLDKMTLWLAQAAAPCALFLLGVTVALRPMKTLPPEVPVLVVIKLVLHPLLIWVLLSAIGNFPDIWIFTGVIMAALPPALNIFMISTQYRVGIDRASACILIGTVVSMVSLTGFLWLVKTGRMAADLFP
ncbi:MAG: AEC family transporter [Bosea sp. (in: a-proteobacteria)]|uniref:AEC family transporter n=1 Tax=Bosea sp. (in: a-proteobacteria) TaxID=1871050 RepID=UPI0027345E85|nr:AEC family transporter [Bosea sp. (in: a-proteobacteria)]MDP3257328.1 AEC family transporter [Bosea sp. (in: a-proteobacteria)]MDP3321490.1 AEC family transporter [Bosea sp. (in: a-proteobacteria)]